MSAKRKCDYRKVYLYVKEWGQKDAMEEFGISPGLVRTIVAIGDAILDKKPPEKDAKTLDKYSPRELMQEWSKNDTVFLNEITDFFENKTVRLQHDLDMYAHWLKSLPERFVLQPKQEWSEEDKERMQSILFSIGYCKDEYPNKKDYTKDIDWLKSLRPQRREEPAKPNIVEELKRYLATTPKEQIKKDWEELSEYGVPDSIEEKPADLEAEIKKFLDKTGAPYCWCNDDEQMEWCSIIARHFYELGKRGKI